MTARRILYLLVLVAALLLHIFYEGYIGYFTVACVASLPFLSLILTLPSVMCLRLELRVSTLDVSRGKTNQWQLGAACRGSLSVSQVAVRLSVHSDMYGWEEEWECTLAMASGADVKMIPLPTDHCGRLTCRVVRARISDALGIFSLPIRLPGAVSVLIMPVPDLNAPIPDLEALMPSALPGKQLGEEYELRDYQPGDSLRVIHWKASARLDRPISREFQADRRPKVTVLLDYFGSPEELDIRLDGLYTCSLALLRGGYGHEVQWMEGGVLQNCLVEDEVGLTVCLDRLLSHKVPLRGTPIREQLPPEPDIVRFFVDGEETMT